MPSPYGPPLALPRRPPGSRPNACCPTPGGRHCLGQGPPLARWEGDEGLRGHRLVQETTRGRLAAQKQRFWLTQALHLVDAALPITPTPDDVRSWPVWDPLSPHVALIVAQATRQA